MPLNGTPRRLYRFGPFTLDATERILLRDGTELSLSPKVLDTLLILVENEGHILEKGELMRSVWPNSFVEESSLTQKIFLIRKVLGEKDGGQPYIETIPRRGYRFVADVVVETIDAHLSAATAITETTIRDRRIDDSSPPVVENRPVASVQTPARPRYRSRLIPALVIVSCILAICAAAGIYQYGIGRGLSAHANVGRSTMEIARLTTTGVARLAAISPDGKYSAYVVDDGGLQSVWLRQIPSNSNLPLVQPAYAEYRGLSFSPDGSFLYYVVYNKFASVGELFQISLLGGTPKKLVDDIDSAVGFSPDGSRIAFLRLNPRDKETYLVIANPDGGSENRMVLRHAPGYFRLNAPSWSPDGAIIAIAAGDDAASGSGPTVVGIQVRDGSEVPLSSHKWLRIGQVEWLKDGSGLILVARDGESQSPVNQIWHLPYPKGEPYRITNDLNNYTGISLASDSKSLVTVQSTRVSRLWVARNGESDDAKLISNGPIDNYRGQLGLAWMPDGRIVYGSLASGKPDLWIMNSDGSNRKQLTFDSHLNIMPAVSPDGRYICFTSDRDGTMNIWRMNADGSGQVRITRGTGEEFPGFSPDGKSIVYSTAEASKQTVWKIPVDGGDAVQLTYDQSLVPRVSPDGKMIVCYLVDTASLDMKMAILSVEDGHFIRFLKTPVITALELSWAADSKSVIYSKEQQGVSNLWSQPVDNSPARQLTGFKSDQIFRFAPSGDGKSLVYERGTNINDVVVINHLF